MLGWYGSRRGFIENTLRMFSREGFRFRDGEGGLGC